MIAAYKFVQKFWILHKKITEEIKNKKRKNENIDLTIYTNKLIEKYTFSLEKFNMNVLIAYLHETYNFLSKEIDKLDIKDLKRKLFKNFNFNVSNTSTFSIRMYKRYSKK